MSNPPFLPLLLLSLVMTLAAGCQRQAVRPENPQAAPAERKPLPFHTTVQPPAESSPDLIYDYLAGEIGLQRGATESTLEHLLRAARQARDPVAAAQAARMALQMDRLDKATEAGRLWVQYEPNSIPARELATILALRRGDMKEALAQADALLKISEATGTDGFLQLATVLAGEKRDDKIRLMQALAAAHSSDPRAHYGVALVASQRKNYALAEQALDQASRLDSAWDKPWLLRAQILALQGRTAEAEETLRRAAREHPAATLYQALGRSLMQRKKYDEALAAFRQAARLDPGNPDLQAAIGLLAIQAEKWDLARSTWQKLARSGDPARQAEAWYFLGQIEELQKHPRKALEYYRKVKEGRFREEARLRMAILTGEEGNLDEAARLFRELRLTNPTQAIQLYVTEAQLYKEKGHPERAMKIYDEAIAANPGNADLLYARGLLAADMDQVEKAVRDLRAVLRLQPDDPDALNALGYTLADQTNRLEEAYGYIRRALARMPDSAPVLDSMGWVLYRMGRREEALKYLQRAASKVRDGEISAHLGEVLWSLGRREEARRVWKEALGFAPDNPKLLQTIQRHR